MNFFKSIGIFLANLFKSPIAQNIFKHSVLILKEVVGKEAEKLAMIAKEEVERAGREENGLTGAEKRYAVFQAIRGRLSFEDFKDSIINVAIETAVLAMKKELGQI